MNLKRFFQWLTLQPGYKSRLKYSDAEYFNLSGKGARVATARREQRAPTLEQIRHVIGAMPSATELDRRNRALIVFTLRGLSPDRSMLMGAILIVDKSRLHSLTLVGHFSITPTTENCGCNPWTLRPRAWHTSVGCFAFSGSMRAGPNGERMKKWCNGRYSTGTAPKALQLTESLGWETGIEPATVGATVRCSTKLSYSHRR